MQKEIASVEMLGYSGKLKWEQTSRDLEMKFPEKKVGDYAHFLQVEFKEKPYHPGKISIPG